MPAARRPAPDDAEAARRTLLTGLADCAALADLTGEIEPLHPRNNTARRVGYQPRLAQRPVEPGGKPAVEDVLRFPGGSWQEVEALPQPLRWTVQRTIFHLLAEPVPTLADPFPIDDPLPGAYELHLPADEVTIWYTVTVHEGQEVISVQHVSLDT